MIRSQVHHSIWHLYEHGSKFKAVDPVDLANFATPQLPVARPKPTASMGIYVDDFFYVGPQQLLLDTHKALNTVFDIAAPDILGQGSANNLCS